MATIDHKAELARAGAGVGVLEYSEDFDLLFVQRPGHAVYRLPFPFGSPGFPGFPFAKQVLKVTAHWFTCSILSVIS